MYFQFKLKFIFKFEDGLHVASILYFRFKVVGGLDGLEEALAFEVVSNASLKLLFSKCRGHVVL